MLCKAQLIEMDAMRTNMRHFGLSGAAAEELKKTVQELLLTWQTQESEREYTQGLNELMALCLQKRTKEEAFARFKELVSKLHPGFLRTNGSMAEPVDMAVCAVFEMLMKKSKVLTDHLHRVDMHFYLTGFMPGWFLSMFASEFAWPASEHLCNRLLEGEAIDRLVPQLVAAAILRSATEIVKLEDADDLIRVLKGSLSEVRTGQDLEALVKEIEEPVEPTLPPEVAEVGSFLVKTVGSGKAGKAKPKTKRPGSGRSLWCLTVFFVQSTFVSFARRGLGLQGAPLPSATSALPLPKGFTPTSPPAALLRVHEIADSPKKVRMLRPAKQPDKSLMKRKIAATTKALDEVRKVRAQQRERHFELGLPIVSLVGYTNAGKSTLMNALAQQVEVKAKDRLFETLDPTRRSVTLPGGRQIMLADTVGFIQRLPEQLVAGFRATLEEVVETTLILHVVDVSSPMAAQQIASVLKTLKRLRKFKPTTPQIMVYNKVDRLEGDQAEQLEQSLSYPDPGIVGHVQISALKGTGFTALSEAIEETLMKHTDFGAASMRLLIPYTDSAVYAKMKSGDSQVKINSEAHTSDGYLLQVTASTTAERMLKSFEVSEEDYEIIAAM
ncbi:hflX [Symbiodinium microadriaticum]|nr:hflX [Symbiodinium microadriaticum]CAE7949818.1 hflX [Symbiodinium sp. KB8]